jgi:hypothetical protein
VVMVARKRVVQRKPVPTIDLGTVLSEYLLNRSLSERGSYHEGALKKQMMETLAEAGELQEGGHRTLHVDDPLIFQSYKTGKPVAKTIVGIERKRRASQSLDENKTLEMLKAKGLMDECTEVVLVVNEDAILAANFQGKITDDELAALYSESESFAFYQVEGDE